jgi:DNA-binding GntR family transcriptional regulator
VSPMTIRRAVGILLDRGLVTTTQGKGTFVRSLDLGEAVFRLQELTDYWTAGESTDIQLLEATVLPAPDWVAEKLASQTGERTIFLRRLIRRGGLPVIYSLEYVIYDPARPLVESQLGITSLEGLLYAKGGGEGLSGGELSIEAVALDGEAAALLEVPAGSPALSLEHRLHDFERRPVSWGVFICRADLFRLTTRFGHGAEPGTRS